MINVFTPNEKSRLDAASINATGRYLLCCVASSDTPVTLSDLELYTGYERERLRKTVKRLVDIGVIRADKRYKKETRYVATFP